MVSSSNGTDIQKLLDEPMHCVGMYIAAISLACALAMAADALHGFRYNKCWCPPNYFPLNATSLALLAVSLKLPMDLNAQIHAITDRLANISSLALMSVAMANSMTSIGTMSNKDVLMNVSALAILVITVCINVFMQIIQLRTFLHVRVAFVEEMVAIGCMILMLFMWFSLSLMLLSTKRFLKKKYNEMDRRVESEEHDMEMGRLVVTNEKLRGLVTKYWVMAETSCPQFVIARSVICVSSGIISVIMAFVLVGALIRFGMKYPLLEMCNSSYEWSTKWILLNQTIGVIVGVIAPVSRWFFAISFRHSNKGKETIESVFVIERYWSIKMVELKASPLCVQISHHKTRKVFHGLKGRILDLCILFQFMTVLVCKLLLLVSASFAAPFLVNSKKENRIRDSSSHRLDVSDYVMLLEGETELPKGTLRNIFSRLNETIRRGKTQRPENLMKLLHKSCKFRGVLDFDSDRIPSLYGQEPPYCWSLPIVTLASIAIALPNVDKSKSCMLLDGVTEGHSLAKRIDKGLDRHGDLKNIRNAANVVWVRVELYKKWQDNDLHKTSVKGTNSVSVLRELASEAEKIVLEFKRNVNDRLMNNPLNWPAKIIAANSMYRICKTILLSYNSDDTSDQTDESLFEQISVVIADLLSACLSNLAHLITAKCQQDAVEKREQSVREAALLFGETEEIRELLQKRELPFLDHDKTVCIEAWRNHLSANSEISVI